MIAAAKALAHRLDHVVGRALGPRQVLVDVRNAMHVAVLEPITSALAADPRVAVSYTAERLPVVAAALAHVDQARLLTHAQACGRRWHLYISADPWTRPPLRRCARQANVFHGVAGKYNLDDPGHLPIEFQAFDLVMFINRDRMDRYVSKGIVERSKAALIGFPKSDRLVNGDYDNAATLRRLGLYPTRRTALYAPTWSPASSLHAAGESIVAGLAAEGWNVIVKLHPLSLDREVEKYSGGLDWRARMAALERPGQIVHVEDADASPLLAASDVMVTDHSTIGYEFCLLDRPLIVFDAPGLVEAARINPERVRELRRAAQVVHSVDALRRVVRESGARRDDLSAERRHLASTMFFEPGGATARAVAAAYDLLALAPVLPFKQPASLCSTVHHSASV